MTKKKKKKTKKKITRSTGVTIDPEKLNITPHPTAGPKIKDFETKLNGDLKKKPTEKRSHQKKVVPEPAFEMGYDLIAQGLKMPFELWANSQKVLDLKLTDPEAITIAKPVKLLLDYYLPNVPEIGIAWLSLAISGYTIMAVRLQLIADKKKEKQNSKVSSSTAVENSTAAGQTRRSQPSPDELEPTGSLRFPNESKPVKI